MRLRNSSTGPSPKQISLRRPQVLDVFKRTDIRERGRRTAPVSESDRHRGRRTYRMAGVPGHQKPAIRTGCGKKNGLDTGSALAITPDTAVRPAVKVRAFTRSFSSSRLFALSRSFSGIGRRAERRGGGRSYCLALVGFGLFLLAIASGHLSLLLRRLTTGVGPYAFRGVSVRRLWLYLPDRFGRSVHPCRRELKKW